MLQQTQVATVIPYFNRWMRRFPSAAVLAAAPLEEALHCWAGLGYYSRARNLHRAAQQIVRDGDGRFPRTPAEWRRLPGVGEYSAGAICSIAFNAPVPAVDGNVTRVLCRVLGIERTPATSLERAPLAKYAGLLVSKAATLGGAEARRCGDLNESLMELGAMVCTPRLPNCGGCPVRSYCQAVRTGDPGAFPEPKRRPKIVKRESCVFVAQQRGHYLVRRRAASGLNASLWEFPHWSKEVAAPSPLDCAQALFGGADFQRLGEVKHSITNTLYRVTVYQVRPRGLTGADHQMRWAPSSALASLPLTGLSLKVLTLLKTSATISSAAKRLRETVARKRPYAGRGGSPNHL